MERKDFGSWLEGPPQLSNQEWPGKRLGRPESGPGSVARIGRRVGALFIDWGLGDVDFADLLQVRPDGKSHHLRGHADALCRGDRPLHRAPHLRDAGPGHGWDRGETADRYPSHLAGLPGRSAAVERFRPARVPRPVGQDDSGPYLALRRVAGGAAAHLTVNGCGAGTQLVQLLARLRGDDYLASAATGRARFGCDTLGIGKLALPRVLSRLSTALISSLVIDFGSFFIVLPTSCNGV